MSRPLRDRELRLLVAMREYEEAGTVLDFGELQRQSGYKPATLKTYVSKKLEGALFRRRADDSYVVSGARACSEEDFADLMAQKSGVVSSLVSGIVTEEDWKQQLEALIDIAMERGYQLQPAIAEIFLDLVK